MMTREEAIEIFEQKGWWIAQKETFTSKQAEEIIKLNDAVNFALSALRPVSRERVERIWFREPYSRLETRQGDDGSIVYSAVNTCMACGHETPIGNFCHNCGAAQTAEGVEIIIKRVEALYGQENT